MKNGASDAGNCTSGLMSGEGNGATANQLPPRPSSTLPAQTHASVRLPRTDRRATFRFHGLSQRWRERKEWRRTRPRTRGPAVRGVRQGEWMARAEAVVGNGLRPAGPALLHLARVVGANCSIDLIPTIFVTNCAGLRDPRSRSRAAGAAPRSGPGEADPSRPRRPDKIRNCRRRTRSC